MPLSSILVLPLALGGLAAQAQSIVAEIGRPVETGTNGAWARAVPTDEGWYMGVGTGGDFRLAPLLRTGDGLEDWFFDRDNWITVTDHGELKDHAIRRCPDGSYLHVSSANNRESNDSAYAWRLSSDFQIQSKGVVEENVPERAHNDMATICSPWVTGAVFSSFGTGGPPTASFFHIGDDANTAEVQELGELQVEGGAFLADAPTDRILLTSTNFDGRLEITSYDPELNQIESTSVDIPPMDERAFWPQAMIRVGQYYLVAMMSMVDMGPGEGDTGDVWLHILDEDFNLLEQHKLTDYGSGRESAMRPWLARQDDLLLVSYDIQTTHTFLAVRLDLDGVQEQDTGFPAAGGGEDEGAGAGADAEADDEGKGSGCASAGGGLAGGLLAAWLAGGLVVGRRRS